jgi:hypothetical protein
MQNLDRRIAALEASDPNRMRRVIRCLLGETPEQAARRYGITANQANVLAIRRVIVDPKEAAHA